MPRGIIGSLVACTILYILFAGVLTGVVHYTELNTPAPVASLVDRMQMPFMGQAMKLGAIAGLTSVMLVMLFSQARIFWIMATDGLLPKVFSTLHPRFRTPYLSSALTGIVVAMTGGLFPISTLGDMVSIGTLFAFVLVCAGVLVLRRDQAGAEAAVPHADGAAGADPGDDLLPGPDVRPRPAHLGAADHLARDRPGDLLRLRPLPQQGPRGGLSPAGAT